MCTNGKIISVRKKGEELSKRIRTNCGQCVECYTTRANSWAYRCYSHYLNADNCYFLTLTLDNDNLTEAPDKQEIQKFHKKLRSFFSYHYNYKKKIKYFLVSEYGYNTERLHYHALYYNLPYTAGVPYIQIANEIARVWGKGIVYVKPFQFEQIYYCIKYLHKDKELGNIRMSSTNLGSISDEFKNYLNSTTNFEKIKVKIGKKQIPLPRYFRKKYMTDEQKEQFADYFMQKNENEAKRCVSKIKLYNFELKNQKWKNHV